MTKITYIAGIGQDESAHRAQGIPPQPFIPYLSLTKGEMKLALLKEQASILAGFYGDPKYKQAEAMLDNALYRGLHGHTPYMGAYDPALTPMVKVINAARRETRPASKAMFFGRPQGIGKGIHIGDPIIDYDARGKLCRAEANKANTKNERERRGRECEQTWRIEKILNDGIEKSGQYLAYGFLPKNNSLPQNANLKIYNQELAQGDIARVGKFDLGLTQAWLNTGMMRNNAEVAKIKPYGWVDTNAILMALPEAGQKEVILALQKARPGTSKSQLGATIAAIIRKYKGVGIGEPITVTIAVITAVTALIGAISKFAQSIKNEQVDAFAQVNGFGSRPFGPEAGDWDGDGITNDKDPTPGTAPGEGIDPLLIGAGLVGAYLLLK